MPLNLTSSRDPAKAVEVFVYALNSLSRNYIYVGMTINTERRFQEHNSGQNKTTKAYRPFNKILVEEFSTRLEARKREKFLKSGIGKQYLKSKVNNDKEPGNAIG